ncbi:N-terminal double-transmembrane domain-containing protein [Bernardetia litoralis DSM 6794]|uniref:N-terminal double-transmembrane domain-containing protein n=1 Tax=Bernardetia litoralis (strain ATCC 23117 / DSM 6794 / NBRC 15988 / NCIMB 1366 / Fx l1 / Sio-4) TaxID=880071 RepID=I4AQ98_BERLS|nr:BatA domain-containing protein [Bernardetia litoralis]AFM06133.1 N-terminal double-transmembrane domain-containing protein [Bernardetia litoralis DSM 6794]
MQFLNPSLLWALSLMIIPVIIHLFNFQRPKKVLFTNVEFLKEVQQMSKSRNRLKHILIMLARMAFIGLLVLAFARPILPSQNLDVSSISASQQVSIYLDNSFSLQNEQDNKRLLDLGATYAQTIPELFPKSATFQFLDNSFEGNTNFFYPKTTISDRLSTIDFSGINRNFTEVYKKQLRTFESKLNQSTGKGGHIFWVSDFQKNIIPNLGEIEFDSAYNYYVLPVSPTQTSNLLVDSVWLENPFVQPNAPQNITIRVRNLGTETIENKSLQLFIDNKQVSASVVSLPAQSSKEVEMNFSVTKTEGTISAKISIEDYPVLFDNDYFFTLRIAPKINILNIFEKKSESQTYIKNVFTNADFFVFSATSTQNLDYNVLQNTDLVVLDGISSIDETLQRTLRKFLSSGGNVLVFPASTSKATDFNSALGISVRGTNAEAGVGLSLLPPSENEPFFEGVFEQISPSMSMPIATSVWSGLSSGQSILKFRNGQPFLMRQQTAEGNVFVCAAPLEENWSGFGKHALFVPTMYKIALSSLSQADLLAYNLEEQTAILSLDSLQKNSVFELVLLQNNSTTNQNSNQGIIPAQRISGNKIIFEIPRSSLKAGVYELRNKQTQKAETLLAFNYSRKESYLDFHTKEELTKAWAEKSNVQIFSLDGEDAKDFVTTFKEQNSTIPLWRYFIIAALVAVFVEIILARVFSRA